MSSAPSSRPATATATSTNARPQQRQLQQPQPSHQRVLSRSSADDDNGDDGEQEEAADEQQPRRLLQPDEEAWQCGLHKDYSLYYALGWALVFEGVFSAMYHVRPSKISFQFDMTFMIIGTGLLFITLYQKRQPVFVPGVYRVFGLFALLVLLNVASLAIDMLPNLVFWVAVLGVMSYVSLLGSYYVYYGARISFFKRSQWQHLWRCVRRPVWPDQQFKFAALLFANALNYAITIYSIVRAYNSASARDFPSVILGIMNADLLIYFSFYVIMKARSGERLCLRPALLMFFTVVLWAGAIVFYEIPLTNKFLTPAESRALNRPCTFLIFDDHDAWHFTSAAAVCTSFFAMFFLDMDIVDKPRTAIAVF